jgi:hypothetical protein
MTRPIISTLQGSLLCLVGWLQFDIGPAPDTRFSDLGSMNQAPIMEKRLLTWSHTWAKCQQGFKAAAVVEQGIFSAMSQFDVP